MKLQYLAVKSPAGPVVRNKYDKPENNVEKSVK